MKQRIFPKDSNDENEGKFLQGVLNKALHVMGNIWNIYCDWKWSK